MARKGILVSDPSVARMTRAQWTWEYMALLKREEEERKFNVKSMKAVLVNVLGLNLAKELDENGKPITWEKMTEEQREAFVPAVMLMGNHRLMGPYVDKINAGAIDDIEQGVTHDIPVDEFEKQSQAMMSDDGDMAPIDPFAGRNLMDEIQRARLEKLGVKTLEGPPSKGVKVKRNNTVVIEELGDG